MIHRSRYGILNAYFYFYLKHYLHKHFYKKSEPDVLAKFVYKYKELASGVQISLSVLVRIKHEIEEKKQLVCDNLYRKTLCNINRD